MIYYRIHSILLHQNSIKNQILNNTYLTIYYKSFPEQCISQTNILEITLIVSMMSISPGMHLNISQCQLMKIR